ncbi:MAG: IPT/TIG domain-containing protein [Chloroflexi bacterium]|nr:IPT/TIG domain-containing protein [Chloroflexota bacterium]
MKYGKILLTSAIALVLTLLLAIVPALPVRAQVIEVTPALRKIGERVDVYIGQLNVPAEINLYLSNEPANIGQLIDTRVLNYEQVLTKIYTGAGELYAWFFVPSRLSHGTAQATVRPGLYYVYLTYFGSRRIEAADTFTVESRGKITLDPKEGAVGSEVKIKGEGFDDREDIIAEYDGDPVTIKSGDRTDSSGNFTATILTPESTAGSHTITVIGDDSGIEAAAAFTTKPRITITPASGTAGDTISVNGTGFGNRADFSIFLANEEVVKDKRTGSNGSFSETFTVPSKAAGSYDIEAEDKNGNSNTVKFTVAASAISLSATDGHSGSEVSVNGSGFQPSQPVTVTFDNDPVATVATDASGKFSATFIVPLRPTGSYVVEASNGSHTITATANFKIDTSTTITPVTSAADPGYAATPVTINGIGFLPGGTVAVTYDGTQVTTVIVGANGDFSAAFTVPASRGGQHTIIATDGSNRQQFTFVMESIPPPTPAKQKPEMGIKAEAAAYFNWEDVTDRSGVTYTLQVATDESFSAASMVLEQTGLTQSEYTITKEARLKSVSKETPYYWRIRAVDGAANESGWSGTGSFYTGFSLGLSQATIYTLLGIVSLLLFVFGFWLGRKTAYF